MHFRGTVTDDAVAVLTGTIGAMILAIATAATRSFFMMDLLLDDRGELDLGCFPKGSYRSSTVWWIVASRK
jgi:hypothetical protein